MDDIIVQSHNQNSIYVLNSDRRPYEVLPRLNLIDPNSVTNKNVTKCQHSLNSITSGNRICSASSQTLEHIHALRNLGNFCDTTETIGNPVTTSPRLLSPTITSPAASCLPPAATAIQKLFNCSYVANVSGSNFLNVMHSEDCYEGGVNVNTALSSCKIKSNNNKKKIDYVKPSLIAKKTKFRKFIENEQRVTCGEGATEIEHQHSANNNTRIGCIDSITPTKFRANSTVKESNAADSTALTATMAAMATCGPLNNIVKHYWNGVIDSNDAGSGKKQQQQHQRQSKPNNWSGSGDSNNSQHHQQRHFKMLKTSQKQKSNCELYKEAVELLGLSCTFCDNCRCLECQSTYFDCDDFDGFSDLSNSEEYDEEAISTLNNSIELVMCANCYSDDLMTTQQRQQQLHITAGQSQQMSNFICDDANCNSTQLHEDKRESSKLSDNEVITCSRQTDAIKQITTQSKKNKESMDLESFTSLNSLCFTDTNDEVPDDNESNQLG